MIVVFRLAPSLAFVALLSAFAACTQSHPSPPLDAATRWRATGDHYALYELVDRYIDPQQHEKVSKADVLRLLGEGIHDPEGYPNAGPDLWVYISDKRGNGSYLYISFDKNGFVKDASWGSE